eukprot:CAMPEP_0113682604 /NCGR_PEP_ID=MMETSP0038_2-20120614/12772_1 /TAXON_ID=2898 /ORGANISM="Cryptomonas paramecium" /LENGTH=317 /DNA_ID=CAMNT_0000601725 /DNA_START=166 /DNA_END=1115 /DNA_ORIENTATION=+ /assembly_acc=CAM_ASM_000170
MDALQYFGFCDDFGPMNMACCIRFIQSLDYQIAECKQKQKAVYCVDEGPRNMSNAVFLLGAYLIIKMGKTASEVDEHFCWIDTGLIESFRDATFAPPEFTLSLFDCWSGLERGRNLGWVRMPTPTSSLHGHIDVAEYEHYDDPLNGDLHEVVPNKFIAFKGPRDLRDREFFDDPSGYRYFSPEYYVDIFVELAVTTVVRLNEPEYDYRVFTHAGIELHDLEFEDCTPPTDDVVEAFFAAADDAHARGGSVAVHCKAGLGRTGTLIALYLMRRLGFSAREAMGWLRIMRPGSVIGDQQQYLCQAERRMREPAVVRAVR